MFQLFLSCFFGRRDIGQITGLLVMSLGEHSVAKDNPALDSFDAFDVTRQGTLLQARVYYITFLASRYVCFS